MKCHEEQLVMVVREYAIFNTSTVVRNIYKEFHEALLCLCVVLWSLDGPVAVI